MASRKYNWPIDDLNGGNVGRHSGMGDRVYLFPSTVPEQGSIPALDPSSLAPRTSAVAKVWNAKKSAIIIAVVLVIALAAAGSGCTVLQRRDSSQMAFDACQQAITINQKSVTRLKKTVESTTSATQTAADAVADPQTIDNLKAAIDKVGDVKQAENSCSPDAEADQNLAADAAITEQTRALGSKNEAILDANDAVASSKARKDALNAKQALGDQLEQLQSVSTSSVVSSADLQTRKQYSDALNLTQQLLLSDQIMSAATYQSASQQLQAAVDKVNQSALQQQQQ